MPQEARLRCRLQEPPGGLAGASAKRRLTKRSRELRTREVRRIPLLGTPVNKALPRSEGARTPKRWVSTETYYVEVSAGFDGEGL